ncbi:MAG: hypothetical protein CMC93_02425 [Flavobacteriaceae bacterium]|nr:hypothetical protein [Flavobacteriaceae bacterium]
MKYILIIISIFIITSCSEKKEDLPKLEGVWQRIGTIVFENGVAVDTLYYPVDSIKFKNGNVIPGKRFKVIADGHSIWFDSRLKKDSLGSFSIVDDMFGKTDISFTKDSIFESFKFWHDNGNKRNWVRNLKEGEIHFKAKFILRDDKYVQYRLRKDGSTRAEFYGRVDNFNLNPTPLTGSWKRVFYVNIVNGELKDTLFNDFKFGTGSGHFQSFTDGKRLLAFNFDQFRDSLGNDRYPGRAQMSDYKIIGDTIVEKIIFRTSGRGLKAGAERKRKFEITDDYFKLYNINSSGNGRINHFQKQ